MRSFRIIVSSLALCAFAFACGDDDAATAPPPGGSNDGGAVDARSDGGDTSPARGDDGGDAAPVPPRSTEEPTVTREPVLQLGGKVWDLAFLPDGAALVTLTSGEIRKIAAGATATTVVADAGSAGAPLAGLFSEGQSGLMGLAIDPAFAENRRIYVYFSSNLDGTKDNRVVRYRLTNEDTLTDRTDIVTGISYKAVPTNNGGAGSHSGGRLRFGPDGFLYLTTGDNHNANIPQDVEALGSKVLRFDTNGQPATGNPNLGSRNLIWAMGFRNPQGISFHPTTGDVFISEHGPNQDDEVTKLTVGANGGWNPKDANGNYNGYTGAKMTDTAAVPTATLPIWKNDDSSGMSANTFLRGESWKAWRDRLAVAFLGGRRIVVLDFDASLSSVVGDVKTIPNVTERVRSVVMGPEERLWVTTDEGAIFRFKAE